MNIIQPWQLLLVTLAGWINRQQQDVIAYIQEEKATRQVRRADAKWQRLSFLVVLLALTVCATTLEYREVVVVEHEGSTLEILGHKFSVFLSGAVAIYMSLFMLNGAFVFLGAFIFTQVHSIGLVHRLLKFFGPRFLGNRPFHDRGRMEPHDSRSAQPDEESTNVTDPMTGTQEGNEGQIPESQREDATTCATASVGRQRRGK
jgi:hypothetical protein